MVARSVRDARFALIPPAIARSKRGRRSENAICRAMAGSRPRSFSNRPARTVRSSGTTTAFQRASSIRTGSTSVSGYIRSAPGRGRMYAVLPSSSIFRVSSGTGLSERATFARPATWFQAQSACFALAPETRITASCSPAWTNSRSRATSSAVTPYAGQFVGVEDAADPALLRVVRHLGPEPAAGLDLAADKAGKARQDKGEDLLCLLKDRGLCLPEEIRDIGLFRPDARVAFYEFRVDRKQALLPLDFAADDFCDEVEFLHALDLDPGAITEWKCSHPAGSSRGRA